MLSHMHGYLLAYGVSSQRQKLDDKAKKCIFVGYDSGSKGYRLYHPLMDKIIVSRDVVLTKHSTYPLVECKFQPTTSSKDVSDTLMPLFQSGAFDYDHENHPNEAQRVKNLQPHIAKNEHDIQPTNDVNLDDVLHEEHKCIKDAQSMPKWLQNTL